jgi:hypothetical protein
MEPPGPCQPDVLDILRVRHRASVTTLLMVPLTMAFGPGLIAWLCSVITLVWAIWVTRFFCGFAGIKKAR